MKTGGPSSSALPLGGVGFGGWAVGGSDWGVSEPLERRRAVVEAAVDAGITLFDTAPTYGGGGSEEVLGDVLATVRDRILIATKCGPHDDPAVSLERSLRRLRTDRVDLFQLHEVPATESAFEDALSRMAALEEDGVVGAIGLCNADYRQLARAMEIARLATLQVQYNVFDRDVEPRLLPFCREHGVGVLAYRPLASGLLAGKYETPPEFGAEDHRSRIYWFRGNEFRRRATVIERLEGMARGLGVTTAQLALAWAIARPGVVSVLAGARTVEQVEENAAAARIDLSEEQVARIDGWVRDAFRPPALHPSVELVGSDAGDSESEVNDRRTGRKMTVGAREAFIMRRLDGVLSYEAIAEAWNSHSDRTLISAQVKVFVDQIERMGLLADGEPTSDE